MNDINDLLDYKPNIIKSKDDFSNIAAKFFEKTVLSYT